MFYSNLHVTIEQYINNTCTINIDLWQTNPDERLEVLIETSLCQTSLPAVYHTFCVVSTQLGSDQCVTLEKTGIEEGLKSGCVSLVNIHNIFLFHQNTS